MQNLEESGFCCFWIEIQWLIVLAVELFIDNYHRMVEQNKSPEKLKGA